MQYVISISNFIFFFLACACSLCVIPNGPTIVDGGVGVD
jgi:hypothetical protein